MSWEGSPGLLTPVPSAARGTRATIRPERPPQVVRTGLPERLESYGFEVECYDPLEGVGAEKAREWMVNPRARVYIARKPLEKLRDDDAPEQCW